MSKKEILVPFDLTKAKNGAKVKTANGRDVRIICYDLRGHKDAQIVALVKDKHFETEDCYLYEQNGRWMDGATTSNDLCIVEEVEEPERWIDRMDGKVKGWCVAYNGRVSTASSNGVQKAYWKSIFAQKKQAQAAAAAAQISQIMANDERFGGVVTDEEWNNEEIYKFILHRAHDRITLSTTVDLYNYIAFHTKEQAELFLEENRDLVEQFYML